MCLDISLLLALSEDGGPVAGSVIYFSKTRKRGAGPQVWFPIGSLSHVVTSLKKTLKRKTLPPGGQSSHLIPLKNKSID